MDFLKILFGSPIPALNPLEAQLRLEDNEQRPCVIDGREPDEYRSSHIAGAKLIPLAAVGYQALNLAGGLVAWERARLPMRKGSRL